MRNRAFTMVELIAATALSTLLFVCALSVIRSLGHVQVNDSKITRGWTIDARQQLQCDLAGAIVMRQDEHELLLAGYGSLDPQTLLPTHLPVTVAYSLHDINSHLWLVREQNSLDPLLTNNNFSELLCGNVQSFSVTGSYAQRTLPVQAAPTGNNDTTPLIFQNLANVQRMPDRVRVRISMKDDSAPMMDTVLYLR